MRKFIILFICVMTPNLAFSGAKFYKYGELQIKDYGEMKKMVEEYIAKARKATEVDPDQAPETWDDIGTGYTEGPGDREAVEHLREAMKLVLSRPDKDNMLEKLSPMIRSELRNFNAYKDTMDSLLSEAIAGIENKKLKPVYKGTYIFVLENIMSEFKPRLDEPEVREIFKKIRDADLKIPDAVVTDRKLRSMVNTVSPSETARKILEKDKERRKKEKEREKKKK